MINALHRVLWAFLKKKYLWYIGTSLLLFLIVERGESEESEFTGRKDTVSSMKTIRLKENGAELNMIALSGGTFKMGSPKEEYRSPDFERPVHEVTLDGYYMGETEVTQRQFMAIMNLNPSRFSECLDCPVERVNWFDAVLFCNALSKTKDFDTVYSYSRIVGTPGDGALLEDVTIAYEREGFRLPTEAEWEYACRAGTETAVWFGEDITSDQVNYNGKWPVKVGLYKVGTKGEFEYRKRTVPVGTLPPNGWGLHEMHGNVSEWCNDYFDPKSYQEGGSVNPTGGRKGGYRVLRGGQLDDFAWDCRSGTRFWNSPDFRYYITGFRIAQNRGGEPVKNK